MGSIHISQQTISSSVLEEVFIVPMRFRKKPGFIVQDRRNSGPSFHRANALDSPTGLCDVLILGTGRYFLGQRLTGEGRFLSLERIFDRQRQD